jgi:hypothetical protein
MSGVTMARAGRKRRDAPRKRGKVDWYAEREDATASTKWHRARDAFLEGIGGDRRMASQAGKLFALRYLTPLEIEAIDRWCEYLSVYNRIIIGKARTVQPSTLERLGVSLDAGWSEERIARFRERFDKAQDAVLQAGRPALRDLNRLCHDEAVMQALPEAHKGLAALIAHWHLT